MSKVFIISLTSWFFKMNGRCLFFLKKWYFIMFSPLKNLVSFVNLIFDYVLVKIFFTTCWHAAIVLRIPLIRPMLHPNVPSTTVVFHFFQCSVFPSFNFPYLLFLSFFIEIIQIFRAFNSQRNIFHCVHELQNQI